jgi:hypothetical protein
VDRKYIGKLEEKRLLGKPKHRREDNIKTYPKLLFFMCMDWI